MKIDLENPGKYWVDENQTIPKSEQKEFASMYRTEMMDRIKGVFSGNVADSMGLTAAIKSPMGILLILCIIAVIVGIFIQNLAVALGGFALAFILGGLSTLFGGKNSRKTSGDMASMKVWGVVMILMAALPFLGFFVIMKDYPIANKLVFGFGSLFGTAGLGLLITTILGLTAKKRAYNEEINANVIGYARYVESDSDGMGYTIFTSPVFEYSYDGERYTAVYDEFKSNADCEYPLGNAVISISPKYPECIYNTNKGAFPMKMFMSIIFVLTGAFTLWLPFTSLLEGSTVNINGQEIVSTAESHKPTFDDSNITTPETDWYVALGKIKEIQTDDQGEILVFEDSAYIMTRPDEQGKYKAGHEYYIIYTVDKDLLTGDQGYKHVLTLVDAEEYEYTGDRLQK